MLALTDLIILGLTLASLKSQGVLSVPFWELIFYSKQLTGPVNIIPESFQKRSTFFVNEFVQISLE